jgi:hypothetical protein
MDGFWEQDLKPKNIAAGTIIVEGWERVTDFAGEPYAHLAGPNLATNGKIHEEMAITRAFLRLESSFQPYRGPRAAIRAHAREPGVKRTRREARCRKSRASARLDQDPAHTPLWPHRSASIGARHEIADADAGV